VKVFLDEHDMRRIAWRNVFLVTVKTLRIDRLMEWLATGSDVRRWAFLIAVVAPLVIVLLVDLIT